MVWHDLACRWLAQGALGGTLVLILGSLAARACPQPVHRARLVILTLLGSLLVPCLGTLPFAPRWSTVSLPIADRARRAVPVARPEAGLADRPGTSPTSRPPEVGPPAAPTLVAAIPGASRAASARASTGPDRPAAWSLAAIPWTAPVVVAYAASSAGLIAWWLFGQWALWRVARAARPASAEVRACFRSISGPGGERVRLLESDRIDLPFTFTWRHPTILLPADLGRGGDADELRYALAHEWSHVEQGDYRSWCIASLSGLVLFYQPLFWWLRRQLRICQDYLADDRAAAEGTPEGYAAYLVRIARRVDGRSLPALGIGDRRSNLYRRVAMLVQDHDPLERRCRVTWSLASAFVASAAMVAASGIRLDASSPGDPPGAKKQDKPAEKVNVKDKEKATVTEKSAVTTPQPAGETLHYSGTVKEKGTGKPIGGATVTVRRSIYNSGAGENKVVEESRHTTDAAGKYRFVIPPDQSSQRRLYIELDVEHPEYAPQVRFGYSLTMIRKNETKGGRPFFENIELRPGKPVSGRVQGPDGTPVKGVKVLAYSNIERKPGGPFEYGSFAECLTDDAGNFKLVLITPGPAVFWILPKDLAPEMHPLPDGKRGDLGLFPLKKGESVAGRLLDSQGKPAAGIYVNAQRERFEGSEILGTLIVADAINRTGITDAEGKFTLGPLPPGTYRLQPDEHARDGSSRETRRLPDVFIGQKLVIKEGETVEPQEIRAVPHAVIEAQWVDGKGKPTWGFESHIFGRIDKDAWFGTARPDANGKVVAWVPHGMEGVQFGLITNEHHAIKYRMSKGAPLLSGRNVMLGTMDHDAKGLEIVHYNAPIVIVKGRTKEGKKVPGLRVSADYTQPEDGPDKMMGKIILAGGVHSDVNFEAQEDGRFRSEQLQPDREVEVKGQAEGFKPATAKVKLEEGKEQDIVLTLEPK